MPELPEMENYKNMLRRKIVGKTITACEVNREKSINLSIDQFTRSVLKHKILGMERRAKYLIFHLDSGNHLLLHLMLGGWMYLGDDSDRPERTHQVILSFGSEQLFFMGLRLGYLHLLTDASLNEKLSDLGPEPLSPTFSQEQLAAIFRERKGNLKSTLVDQHVIAGIGNRYSDEICFEARLRPDSKVNEMNKPELSSLYTAMRTVLANAVQFGGYMDRPVFRGDERTGGFESRFNVYNRENCDCKRCGAGIVKDDISSKKTFYCPNCQHNSNESRGYFGQSAKPVVHQASEL